MTLALADLFAMADRSIFAAIAPLVGQRYALTKTELGILLGPAFAATYCAAAIAFGVLVDRGHARRLVLAGLALQMIAAIVLATSDGFTSLLIGRVLLGLGQGAVIPTAIALLAGATAENVRARALATLTGASVLGRSTGLLLVGAVLWAVAAIGGVPSQWGWRVALLVTLAPMLVFAGVLGRLLRTIDLRAGAKPAGTAAARLPAPKVLIPLFAAAVSPILIGQSVAAWMPALLVQRLRIDPAAAAALLGGVVLVFAPVAQVVGGWATGRITAIRTHPLATIALCLILAEPFLMLAWLTQRQVLVATGIAGATLLVGMAGFVGLFAVQAAAPAARRGAMTGLFMALVTLVGAGGGPLLTGLLGDRTVFGQALEIGASLSLVGAVSGLIAIGAALFASVTKRSVVPVIAARVAA